MSGFLSISIARNRVYNILIALIFLSSSAFGQTGRKPFVIEGKLDLSSWNLDEKSIELNGDWFFYWNQLLTPQDGFYPISQKQKTIKTFPGLWTEYDYL